MNKKKPEIGGLGSFLRIFGKIYRKYGKMATKEGRTYFKT